MPESHLSRTWIAHRGQAGEDLVGIELPLAQANDTEDRMVLIATEPLTRNEPWRPFAPGELRVYATGEQLWRHTPVRHPQPVAQFGSRLAMAS